MTITNGTWHPNGAGPKPEKKPLVTSFFCTADISDGARACGTKLAGKDAICPNSHLHFERPMPFVKRVEAGLHIPQPIKVAKPFGYGAQDYVLA